MNDRDREFSYTNDFIETGSLLLSEASPEGDVISLDEEEPLLSKNNTLKGSARSLVNSKTLVDSEEPPNFKKNPFLTEVEEVEYFDSNSGSQVLIEQIISSDSQHLPLAAKIDYLDTLYYIYRVIYAFLNLMLILLLIFSLLGFFWVVIGDILKLVDKHKEDLIKKVTECQRNYDHYECEAGPAKPAIVSRCKGFDTCRNVDLSSLPLAEISFKALAAILNGFFNELSYKAMIFSVVFIFVWLSASALLSWVLRPQSSERVAPIIYQAPPPVPPTPTRRVRHYSYQATPQLSTKRAFLQSRTTSLSEYCD